MRRIIGVLCTAFALNSFASGCYLNDKADAHSEANFFRFHVSVESLSEKSITFEVKVPFSIDGIEFESLILARPEHELGAYLFPIQMAHKEEGRFTTGFELLKSMVNDGILQFSYNRCDMVFTYPIERWIQTEGEEVVEPNAAKE